jgi:hypothetical protein
MKTFGATCVRRAPRTKNLRSTAARAANHSTLIRSFFDRIQPAHAVCTTNFKKYFCLCRCRRRARCRSRIDCGVAQKFCRANKTMKCQRCKKSLFNRYYCNILTVCSRKFYARVANVFASRTRGVDGALRAKRGALTHMNTSSHCFFCFPVVNEEQCVSIRDRTNADIRHVSWLGGQQWRNVERRRQWRRSGRRGSRLLT